MIGDGSKLVTYGQATIYGDRFQCSRRTAAHLDRTKARLAKKAKKDHTQYKLIIMQGCYNTSVGASAGTHDKDSCLDVRIEGMGWAQAQRWLRTQGWAAFWRKPEQGPWSDHIHMISLPPYKTRFVQSVGIYVPGQVNDYYAHKNGLASHAPDPYWHPRVIAATIFSYRLYVLARRGK